MLVATFRGSDLIESASATEVVLSPSEVSVLCISVVSSEYVVFVTVFRESVRTASGCEPVGPVLSLSPN